MNKADKIRGYINSGKIVFDITINADTDPNYKNIIKWVLNDRWMRDPVGVELKNDNTGSERVYLFNSFDLEHYFGGVDGIKRDMTRLFKNNEMVTGFKVC